jgi:hypothetical protein
LFLSTRSFPDDEKLLLNISATTSAFWVEDSLSNWIKWLEPKCQNGQKVNLARLGQCIKGLRVRTTYLRAHGGGRNECVHTVDGIAETVTPQHTTFTIDDKKMTVDRYLRGKYLGVQFSPKDYVVDLGRGASCLQAC